MGSITGSWTGLEFKEILLDVKDNIATITLNRPQFGNALATGSYGEIRDAVQICGEDENVRAIVIRSTGKHFSAGGDLKRFKSLIDSKEYLNAESIMYAGEMTSAIRRCTKPVIAMIQGVATGAGCSLAVACDFRVATRNTKFVMGFVKLGLTGDTGSMYFLYKLIGLAKASEMLMLGDPVNGEDGYRMGLVTKLVEEEDLESETYSLARRLADSPTQSLRLQKKVMMEFFYQDLDAYSIREGECLAQTSRTEDFEEAVNAFLEKRQPVFVGK